MRAKFSLVLGVLALSLGACSHGAAESQVEVLPGQAEFEYSAWRPETKVELGPQSPEQLSINRLNWVEGNRTAIGIEQSVPVPDLVRWIELGESHQAIVDCMAQNGFAVSLDQTGEGLRFDSATGGSGDSGTSPISLQIWLCYAQFTPKSVVVEHSPAMDAVLYEYYTTFFVPCMRNVGVEFVEEPPSKDVWLASRLNPQGASAPIWEPVNLDTWSAESQRKYGSYEAQLELFERCPARPPVAALYGE
ncbi:MAG: hypothetical protein Q3999_05325 [Buchananella hordeovulneris]|nr:hypothetical protein [Buchananella hordeovulneris]